MAKAKNNGESEAATTRMANPSDAISESIEPLSPLEEFIELSAELSRLRDRPVLMIARRIDDECLLQIRKLLSAEPRLKSYKAIDVVLVSLGGGAGEAYKIITDLQWRFSEVNVIVPSYAKSAATLLSLGATTIYMHPYGELGPLDAQIPQEPNQLSNEEKWASASIDEYSLSLIEQHLVKLFQNSFAQASKNASIRMPKTELAEVIGEMCTGFYRPLLDQLDPTKIGEKRRILSIASEYASELLSRKKFASKNEQIPAYRFLDYLIENCPEHGFVLDIEKVSRYLTFAHPTAELDASISTVIDQMALLLLENLDEFFGPYGMLQPVELKLPAVGSKLAP